ncbi:type III secretion system chaperone family protein [Paraoerskovia marina]|uniref:YbjN domain-containing protein n=1 Tax=Paraoerskovia marina TaxID=545619 RepID=UPI00155F9936|nr:YbjN domain-containing protein [Paraoerskovia marina]
MRLFGGRRRTPDDAGLRSAVEDVLVRELGRLPDAGNDRLRPLDVDRLHARLLHLGINAARDVEDDLVWSWRGREFTVRAIGADTEILDLRADWPRTPTIDRLAEFWRLCNAWNAERVWPTASVRVDDDGEVLLGGRVSIDVETGVSEAQLDHLLRTAIGSTVAFFDAVDGTYPDPIAEAP